MYESYILRSEEFGIENSEFKILYEFLIYFFGCILQGSKGFPNCFTGQVPFYDEAN